MASVFQKLRNLVLSNVHALLDAAIDLNSVQAVRQHIRDLEDARDRLVSETATATGNVTTVQREVEALNRQIEQLNSNIDLILSDGDDANDHFAEKMELQLGGLEEELASKNEELEAARTTRTAIAEATAKVTDKHASMVSQLRRLESLERTTAAKEAAAGAIRAASASAGDTVSVDSVTRRLQKRADAADAQLTGALGTVTDAGAEEVERIKARQRLAERKARLAGGGATPSTN